MSHLNLSIVLRRNLKKIMFFSLASLFFSSCTKSTPEGNSTSSLTSFSFSQLKNQIPVNSDGSISGTSIQIFLPPGTNTNALIPDFTLSDSAIVRINGIEQQSGITSANFSTPVTYSVTSR